jgi:hypothetical protein
MPSDEQDKAGVIAPPPLIYLGTLIFGLLLGRRSTMRFLPRTMARGLGWPLLGKLASIRNSKTLALRFRALLTESGAEHLALEWT